MKMSQISIILMSMMGPQYVINAAWQLMANGLAKWLMKAINVNNLWLSNVAICLAQPNVFNGLMWRMANAAGVMKKRKAKK